MSALDHYRAPASGLVLVAPLVPLDPWRCRWFGHRLWGWWVRAHRDTDEEREFAKRGCVFHETEPFPSRHRPSSRFDRVWCERCGREWTREEQGK